MALLDRLEKEEEFRSHPYDDATGEPWVNGESIKGKLTIGIGFNIDPSGPGLTREESRAVLAIRAKHLEEELLFHLPFLSNLDPARKDVLLDMVYNLGVSGLLAFHCTLAMVEAGNYEGAAAAMWESTWAKQVGQRAIGLSEQMKDGIQR